MANSVVVRQGMDKSNKYWRCFPPFLWLLRDVLVCMPERNGRKLTPTEFLITEVLGSDNSDSMKVAVRKTLTQCFPTFECKTLPPPSTCQKVMANISTSSEKLTVSFNQGVDELIAFIKANIKAKKVFGTKCDGPTFAILVKEVSKGVNDPQSIPAVDSTWKLVVESHCRSVQERLLSEYCNILKYRYDETSKGGPIEEVAEHELEHKKSLMGIHETLWSELRKKLNNELGPLLTLKVPGECTMEMVTDQLEKQLIQTVWEANPCTQARVKRVVDGAFFPIAEENRKRSWKFCDQLFTDLYTPIREKVQTTEGEDEYTPDKLAADIQALLQEYDAKSVGPEKWRVRAAMEATIKQNKELFQNHLHEVLLYAQKKREAKQMYENLRNELRELIENRNQIAEKFDNFAKQQQEAEERRQQELDTEMKELKEKLKIQEEKEKEMNAKEMKQRIEDAQWLTEESLLRERAEEKLKEMEKTLTKNKEESIQKAKADEEIKKLKQKIEENKHKEAKRKNKSEQEIEGLKAAKIKGWEQKLKQKEQEEDEQKVKADNIIKEMEETLREKEKKEAEEEAKHKKKLRQKTEEYHEQQLIIERMKGDHAYERMVQKIKQEKEEERKQKERVQEEARITIDHLHQLIEDEKTEKELQKKEWVESLTKEKGDLSSEVKTLSREKGDLSSKVKTLSKEKGALTSKVETLSKDKRALTSQVNTLSKEKEAIHPMK